MKHRCRIWAIVLLAALLAGCAAPAVGGEETTAATQEEARPYSCFTVAEPETVVLLEGVPDAAAQALYIHTEKTRIGGILEACYVRAPSMSGARQGVLLLCTDDMVYKSGSSYDAYVEEDCRLRRLEEQTFTGDFTVRGQEFHVELDWAEYEGNVVYTHVPDESGYWMMSNRGREKVLLRFELITTVDGEALYTPWLMLLNLQTGEMTDILAGTGAENLPPILSAVLSGDGNGLLLTCEGGSLYYADLAAKKLYSLEALLGSAVEGCTLTGNTLVCWTFDGSYVGDRAYGDYVFFAFDLTGEVLAGQEPKQIFVWDTGETESELVFLSGYNRGEYTGGLPYTGCAFALEADPEGNVSVIDLTTGETLRIPDFSWPESEFPVQCKPSPDGTRLLIYSTKPDNCYDSVAVLDFVQRTVIRFRRSNPNQVNEERINWLGSDRFVVETSSLRPEDLDKLNHPTDYYFYKLP